MPEDPIIENADKAAEALAKSSRDSTTPSIDPSREAELDAIFKETQQNVVPVVVTPENFGRENGGVPLVPEGTPKPAPEEKEPTPEKTADVPEKTPDAPTEKKGLLDDLLAEKTADKPTDDKPADDPYGTVKLRSDASPKTRETFEQLKTVAKQREDAARAESVAAKQSLSELQNKVAELEKRTVPDEVQNELKELRAFRAQFDTERDPEFRQKFDGRVDQNYDAIYGKLKAHGLPDSEIGKLKAYSIQERDSAIENFLSKLPSFDRKYIEAKLLDNINISDEREKALKETRAKADEILKQRKDAPAVQTAQRDAKVAEILRPALPKLPWIHVKEIPATAAPEERKRIESENTFAAQMQEALKIAIIDDSPAVRAEAAIAVPLAQYYRRELTAATEKLTAAQKQLDEIRQAGALSRTARSVGNAGKPPVEAPKAPPANSGDAVDELFAQITGAQRR